MKYRIEPSKNNPGNQVKVIVENQPQNPFPSIAHPERDTEREFVFTFQPDWDDIECGVKLGEFLYELQKQFDPQPIETPAGVKFANVQPTQPETEGVLENDQPTI